MTRMQYEMSYSPVKHDASIVPWNRVIICVPPLTIGCRNWSIQYTANPVESCSAYEMLQPIIEGINAWHTVRDSGGPNGE